MSEYDRVSVADDSQHLVDLFVEGLTLTAAAFAKSTYDVSAPREADFADYRRLMGKRRDAIEHRVHELCEALEEARRDVGIGEATRITLAASLKECRRELENTSAREELYQEKATAASNEAEQLRKQVEQLGRTLELRTMERDAANDHVTELETALAAAQAAAGLRYDERGSKDA